MSRYVMGITDALKKRGCIYLLQRYLGKFFDKQITSDQLSLDLFNGKGTVENVSLNIKALNELGKEQNWPLEFVNGYIEKISFTVPWSLILKDSTYIEVQGMVLTFQPKERVENVTSMFETMWSSMTNSMQLAKECMQQDAPMEDNSQQLEGIEMFAQAIDSVLSRVKVKLLNTVIQLEHVPKHSLSGVGLTINIDLMEYSDDASNDPPTGEPVATEQKKAFVVAAFTTKNFFFEGVSLSTLEFGSESRTFSREFKQFCDKNEKLAQMMASSSLNEKEYMDVNRHVIPFGKFEGRQEIRLRMKQTEDMDGPKVSIEINLGALSLFMSPRQVYVLAELISGLSSQDASDKSYSNSQQNTVEKPMTNLDYQRVEEDLQHQIHPLNTFQAPGLQGIKGWSTGNLDESDNDDNFLPMHPSSSGLMYESTTSNVSSSMESSLSSSIASSTSEATTNRSRRRTNNIAFDPTAEISHFQIKLASIALVVLHEDLLALSTDSTLLVSSVKQMQNISNNFLMKASRIPLVTYGKKSFDEIAKAFNRACDLNQLRLLASPIQIECNETTTTSEFSLSGKMTIAKIELSECLKQDDKIEHIKILKFSDETSSIKPSFRMNFKHTEKTLKTGLAKRLFIPKTDINISLDPCTLEIDITLMDRISALLNSPPVCLIQKPKEQWAKRETTLEEISSVTTTTESQLDIKVSSDQLIIKICFPIPDFRPANDRQKTPWWKRNVRASYLTLHMTKFTGNTNLHTNQVCQKYVMQAKIIDINYHEKEGAIPLHIAKVAVDERMCMQDGFNFPRFVVMVYPLAKVEVVLEDEPEVDLMSQSCYGSLYAEPSSKGPFSCKRVIHESDTPHAKQDDTEEMVIPGDKHEISDFIEMTTRSSRIQLDLSLPTVSLQLLSKHIYEVLYNHISSDLLLWEPSAPAPTLSSQTDNISQPMNFELPETFAICKSGIKGHSDPESDGDDEDNVFHSVYTDKLNQRKQFNIKPKGQSYLTLNLHIGQGLVCMNPPMRDAAGNVIPEQNGEFILAVDDVSIFSVTGYKGDENLGYVCIQSKGAQLHHCDMSSSPSFTPPLRDINSITPGHMHSTLYKSEPGMLVSARDRGGDREMLSVAVKIQANHETHHVKTVCVAVGISKATLRHRMCSEPNSWITQLVDFFNVNDYTIPGFHAKDVLTELHLHLWDCAIDYRPFHLPLRSVVTMGTFSMSSHLSATANTSTLRFIAEECALFLSEKDPPRKGIPSNNHVDLLNDYVAVVDLGLFELSIRTNDKVSGINPHFDLRASNNIVNIRTCADSGRALMQLITYVANDGDLTLPEAATTPTSTYTSPRHNTEPKLVNLEPQPINDLSNSQHQEITEMMNEAMQENVTVQIEGKHDYDSPGAKVFFFPDEKRNAPVQKFVQPAAHPPMQVTTELGDVTYRSNKSSDTDEEFCIIGDETPRNSVPEIKWLSDDPLRIVDNHFEIPIEKADVLRPPKHFPIPVERYTLCDMSVLWQMYGGNDFKKKNNDVKERKTVNFNDTVVTYPKDGVVAFDNFMPDKSVSEKKVSWIVNGGVNRDHNTVIELQLNKVRFQHELYPENTLQASRQVLFVNDLEVRDRLTTSGINKFLYQYSSTEMPKQSHAYMIGVRALHIRPDKNVKVQECSLKVSLLPLRLHIDQDTLLFLIDFFNNLSTSDSKKDDNVFSSKHNTPTHRPPVFMVSAQGKKDIVDDTPKTVDENLMLLLDEACSVENPKKEAPKVVNSSSCTLQTSPPIYFRRVVFAPDVFIRLDYIGKRFDMTHGPIAGLIMCLGQLNRSELKLKRLCNNHGILGFDKLLTYFLHEWMNDIKKNQLPSLLVGVGPMHSLVQFFQGIKDLFWMPIEQYQKDGRIVRGLQRGANSFTTSTAMAALELTSRIIHLIQLTAETAYDMMSPGPSVRKAIKPKGRKRRYNQPQDIREGVANAFSVVKEGLGETAENIVRVASHEREQKGYSGALGGVLRQIPPTFVKPIILATEATSNVLGGVQNQLLPDVRREAAEKWKVDG